MAKEEHKARKGFVTFLKIILIIIFMISGACCIVFSALKMKNWSTYQTLTKAVYGTVMAFGCIQVIMSPFFLKQEREGFFWVLKILTVVVFIIFGAALITCAAIDFSEHPDPTAYYPEIIAMVFGSVVLTSPILLLA